MASMLEPAPGLAVAAEYGAVAGAEAAAFGEADLAVALLRDAGIDASLAHDPALRSSVQYWASDRVIRLLVPERSLEEARRVLDEAGDGLPPEFHEPVEGWDEAVEAERLRRSARRRQAGLVALALVLGVPVLVVLLASAAASLLG